MFAVEQKFADWVKAHALVLLIVVATVLGLVIRVSLRYFVSGDAQEFLIPWYEEIQLTGLSQQVGDYGIPYQFMILLLTYLPIHPLYAYKILSCVFDVVLAVEAYLLVRELTGNGTYATFAYAAVLLLPAVFINSALWAQCDSVFSSFCLAALRRLHKKQWRSSFLLLGVAFAFKLQAVFIVPFFLYVWLINREFSLANLGFTLVGFLVPNIPGFIAGRSVLDPFLIYAGQTGTYEYMFLNFPSFWVLTGGDYATLKNVAIVLTVAILGCALVWLLVRGKRINTPRAFLALAVWTSWTCVLFLPAMHERYIYLVNILLLLLMFLDKRAIAVWLPAMMLELITFQHYPFGATLDYVPLAVVELVIYAVFTFSLFGRNLKGEAARADSSSAIW